MNELELWIMCLGYTICFATGFLIGRNALKASIEKRVKKEIYEQGKLDGAYEFIHDSLFAGIAKR
jgi:hypothetical protein